MLKSDLIKLIHSRYEELYQRDIENVVDAILETIVDGLSRGKRVEIRGFGVFAIKDRRARNGRNPRTGEPVAIDGKRLPFFKPSKEMHKRLNKPTQPLVG